MISSALFAAGIRTFGHHAKDNAPQGIYCANGQCGQCMVIADGVPVKACITPLEQGMKVQSVEGLPELPEDNSPPGTGDIETIDVDVFVVGGGPSGLAATMELASLGVNVLIADDKNELGGKLSLQTHNFFGSITDCYAGTRGMDIGTLLSSAVRKMPSVDIWLNSPVVGVFNNGLFGCVNDGAFKLIRAQKVLITTGAREKTLAFQGCDLPGVYGAGAFQTLVNRDQIKASDKLFIVGGGNVGLIAAYHALQAGIEVVGLVEALPKCGGYKVHLDKILRLGVPVYTSHTILKAEGDGKVERVYISAIDNNFKPIEGTEMAFDVDTVLIAVGLSSVDELLAKAKQFGLEVYAAGDADEVAEASAAIFSGKIIGRKILSDLGHDVLIPEEWFKLIDMLRSKPGPLIELPQPPKELLIYPIIRCVQEIPCNPCTEVCPIGSINIPSGKLTDQPMFSNNCLGCGRCVGICPGLSIVLVDKGYDETKETAAITVAWELPDGMIEIGQDVITAGFEGEVIGKGRVIAIKESEWLDRRRLVKLEVPFNEVDLVAGIRIIEEEQPNPIPAPEIDDDSTIICRCERVTKGEIREQIRNGCRDFNSLKAATRVCMGACGGKTCKDLIWRIFREEGIELENVKEHIERPFTQEVPMNAFVKEGKR